MSAVRYHDAVAGTCATLCAGGVVLGAEGRSVGPWTPAVPDDFSWAVLGLQGEPLVLAHDAFEVAYAFARLESGEMELDGVMLVDRDAYLADLERFDEYQYRYRFTPFGDPDFIPQFPRRP